ncbi:MAG: hypothetical protein JWN75_1194 [Candidatus Saccharibacteria bacterium]|nr:hypothetical protein [Candidatus Saccharibacteria bacterium]
MTKYNKCGVYHLGRCCVNGSADGRRPTCDHCGEVITSAERLQIARSFERVHDIKRLALLQAFNKR